MHFVRRGFTGLALVTLMSYPVLAQKKADTVDSLRAEMQAAQQKYVEGYQKSVASQQETLNKALAKAKTEEEKKALRKKYGGFKAFDMRGGPLSSFAPRFLAFAEKHPDDPTTMEALNLALGTSGGPADKTGTWKHTVQILRDRYVAKPEIKQVLRSFAFTYHPESDALLDAVHRMNPDRKIQAMALKSQAGSLRSAVQIAETIKQNPSYRGRIEAQMGKIDLDFLLANVDRFREGAESLLNTVRTQYRDVLPDLSVGQPAPEVVSRHLDGSTARLSELKGKVVVLDIWATWCGPCRQMIPHEREMVERLKEKPFALISISADEQLKTLTDFLEKEKMPWTHWWNGSKGGLLEDWDIEYFPTIYVLDSSGVIRHKDLRGEELEKAVIALLAEPSAKGQ